jgi:hypothetical protein
MLIGGWCPKAVSAVRPFRQVASRGTDFQRVDSLPQKCIAFSASGASAALRPRNGAVRAKDKGHVLSRGLPHHWQSREVLGSTRLDAGTGSLFGRRVKHDLQLFFGGRYLPLGRPWKPATGPGGASAVPWLALAGGLGTASPHRYVPVGAGSAYHGLRVEDISALGGENADIRAETQHLFLTVR